MRIVVTLGNAIEKSIVAQFCETVGLSESFINEHKETLLEEEFLLSVSEALSLGFIADPPYQEWTTREG